MTLHWQKMTLFGVCGRLYHNIYKIRDIYLQKLQSLVISAGLIIHRLQSLLPYIVIKGYGKAARFVVR